MTTFRKPIENNSATPNLNDLQAILKNGILEVTDLLIVKQALMEVSQRLHSIDNTVLNSVEWRHTIDAMTDLLTEASE